MSITKPVSVKQEPKASSSLPSGSNNGKPIAAEKVKKEAEKRPADKVSSMVTVKDIPGGFYKGLISSICGSWLIVLCSMGSINP